MGQGEFPTLAELMLMAPKDRRDLMARLGLTPADYGETLRSMGINPRALGEAPRQQRARR